MTYNEMFASSMCSGIWCPPPSSECGVICVDGVFQANIACNNPRFVRITWAPVRWFLYWSSTSTSVETSHEGFEASASRGGVVRGTALPFFVVVSLDSSFPLRRRVVSEFSPSHLNASRWQVCLVLWPKNTQETPVDRSRIRSTMVTG